MPRKLLIGFALSAAATAAATTTAGPVHAQGIVPAPRVVTTADNGKSIAIARGQQLNIKLSECRTCGFRWATREKPDAKILRRLPTRTSNPCKPPCVGGANTTIFRYEGRAAGRTALRLVYLGPGSETATKTFRLKVRVRR